MPNSNYQLSNYRRALLARCENRAIELYYAGLPDTPASDCRAVLDQEFGPDIVAEMLRIGIGNNNGVPCRGCHGKGYISIGDGYYPDKSQCPMCRGIIRDVNGVPMRYDCF